MKVESLNKTVMEKINMVSLIAINRHCKVSYQDRKMGQRKNTMNRFLLMRMLAW
jgi:hypothetical protein